MALPNNVTNRLLLATRQYERTDSLEVPNGGGNIPAYRIVLVDGSFGTAPATEIPYGITITEGVDPAGLSFGASATINYFTISLGDYVYCEVEAGSVIAQGDPITFAVAGNGRAVTAASGEHYLGHAMNSSDGSGTALVPHYIMVRIDKGQLA